jgi:hypothetical protein
MAAVGRCGHCNGNLIPHYDTEAGHTVKCLQCGREPRKERPVESNIPAAINGNAANNVAAHDPVGEYTLAARGLLAAAEAHRAALATEKRVIADARAAIERATSNLAAARRNHEAARLKLDAALSGVVGQTDGEPQTEAPPADTERIGVCKGCGQAKPLKRGRCSHCWSQQARRGHEGRKAAAEEVAA